MEYVRFSNFFCFHDIFLADRTHHHDSDFSLNREKESERVRESRAYNKNETETQPVVGTYLDITGTKKKAVIALPHLSKIYTRNSN